MGAAPPPILADAVLLDQVQDLAGCRLPEKLAARIRFAPARLSSRGDLSTDAALRVGQPAAAFAERLAERLARLECVRDASAAGAGFVNLSYTDAALDGILPALLGRRPPGRPREAVTLPLAAMRRADPGFMVQYAHARCHSVLRAAAAMPAMAWDDPAALAKAAAGWFISGLPRILLCRLDHWMRIVAAPDPLHGSECIPLFLRDLSSIFDRIWKLSHDDATVRLLYPEQPSRTLAQLALVLATADVIRSGLALQGLEAAEELR